MPQVSVVSDSPAASRYVARSPFVCTWKAAGLDAAWVLLAGRLDLTTSPKPRLTVQDAQLHARVVVLDMRKLTFMDAAGVSVILNAACGARRDGGRVMLVRGPANVDEMLTLTAASDEVLIVDLDQPSLPMSCCISAYAPATRPARTPVPGMPQIKALLVEMPTVSGTF
jgi:anti-anti-sigma factor